MTGAIAQQGERSEKTPLPQTGYIMSHLAGKKIGNRINLPVETPSAQVQENLILQSDTAACFFSKHQQMSAIQDSAFYL
jgi:hypothetical protein